MKYRITHGGKHSRWEGEKVVTYRAGDVIELTKAEAKGASLAGRVEPVEEAKPKGRKRG